MRPTRRLLVAQAVIVLVVASFTAPVAAHERDGDESARLGPLEARIAAHAVRPEPAPAPASTLTVGGPVAFGVFEDANVTNEVGEFDTMIAALRARGIESVMFTNGFIRFHEPLADLSDARGFDVYSSWAMGELQEQWFGAPAAADIATARRIVGPLVDALRDHPSIKGYNLIDDAPPALHEKMRLAAQVFAERDPGSRASPMFPYDIARAGFNAVQSAAFLTYHYPARAGEAPCSWTGRWLTEQRATVADKPAAAPLWTVLQTHRTTFGPAGTVLRTPTVEEVRLQNFLALGEGSQGIWWFAWSSQQGWTGLKDNAPLLAEVTDLARRTNGLPRLTKTSDRAVAPGNYASTLSDGTGTYVLAAATGCETREVTVLSHGLAGRLRDVESGELFSFGESIPFRGGDGRLFRVVP